MDLSTGAITGVTDGTTTDTSPSWSPDGTHLIFGRGDLATRDLYVIGIDGSGLTQVTSTATTDNTPDWSPIASSPPPADVPVQIQETVLVTDIATITAGAPAVTIQIQETIAVTDTPTITTTASTVTIQIQETIAVTDTPTVGLAEVIELETTETVPGQEIEFSGDGFGAGTDIDIGVESEFCLLDVVQADELGAFSTIVTVPGSEECPGLDAGAHTLVAKGLDPNGVAFEIRAPIEILAPVQITLASSNPEEVPVGETFVVRASVGNPSGAIGHTTFDPTVVSMRLQPVGPGSDVTPDRCEASAVGGTDGYLVQCAFSTTQVNTYIVLATIDDGSFLGSDEGVLTVTDGRHFVTGGGWFEWPTSAETTYVELV
ncbi:MAG: hypothetical protein R3324_17200, partial [Halobacteriales archaeon]|nr:hypothetical protein [Halobacteriales archaeon]